MKNPFAAVEAKPEIRPMLNVGCLLDIPSGRWRVGMKGESIIDGGRPHIVGIGGRGNMYKSMLAHYYEVMCAARYGDYYRGMAYDTEGSLDILRFVEISEGAGVDVSNHFRTNSETFVLTDSSKYLGDTMFKIVKDSLKDRNKDKGQIIETPFKDSLGNPITMMSPLGFEIDSMSMLRTASVEKIIDAASAGDAKRNTESMQDGRAKSQMINEMSTMAPGTGLYVTMTAHLGDVIEMEKYNPTPKQLAAMAQGTKFKGVPANFTFLTNICWLSFKLENMLNQKTKLPEFPYDNSTAIEKDEDLKLLSLITVRNKSGPSGHTIKIILSQKDGFLVPLSEFYNCKDNSQYGMVGNQQNYAMALLPDVKLSRTVVRRKLDENARLRRAVNITSEILQDLQFNQDSSPELYCSMEELYEDLKNKGYDWDRLLDTRGYWVPDQYTHPVPYLSSMDLLNMRKGTYHPYWYGDLPKPKG